MGFDPVHVFGNGRLTRDAKVMQSGKGIFLSIATSPYVRDDKDHSQFLDWAFFTAEPEKAAERFTKGTPVTFVGEVMWKQEEYKGEPRFRVSGNGRVYFTGPRRAQGSDDAAPAKSSAKSAAKRSARDDDELPWDD